MSREYKVSDHVAIESLKNIQTNNLCFFCCYCSPGGIPARNAKGERLLLYIGIIDILQSYRLKKKLEHTWKSMIHDGVSTFFKWFFFIKENNQ